MEASQSEMTRVGVPLPGTEQSYTPRIGETGEVAQHSPLHDSAALRFDALLKGAASGSLKAVKVSPHGSLPNTAPALVCSSESVPFPVATASPGEVLQHGCPDQAPLRNP